MMRKGRPSGGSPPAGATGRRPWATALALVAVVAIGGALRLVGPDWDGGQHLHPDERFLTMVEGALDLPPDLLGYFDTDTSPANPRNRGYGFFVYGTWPITLVQAAAQFLEGLMPPVPTEPAALAEYAGWSDSVKRGVAWFITGRPSWPAAFTDYGHVYLVGRRVVGIMDTLALLALFALGARLYDRRVGLLAATLGAFTAFHIQQAHFFTADAPANFFVVLALVGLAGVAQGRWGLYPPLAGVAMGMALGSKISVWPLVPLAVVAAVVGYGPTSSEGRGSVARGVVGRRRSWLSAAAGTIVLGLSTYAALRVAQPDMWAGPGWPNVVENGDRFAEVTAGTPSWWFTLHRGIPDAAEPWLLPDPRWASNMAQIRSQITGHGMDWPPNHQWWGRRAYVFPWKNMVLWGMGIPLGLAAWAGWTAAGVALLRGRRRHLIPFLWVAMNFAYLGVQWAKTMRYYLPMYPALTVLAAWGLVAWWDRPRRGATTPGGEGGGGAGWPRSSWTRPLATASVARAAHRLESAVARWGRRPSWPARQVVPALVLAIVVGGTALWGVMVSRIYVREHSRIAGSRWIYHNVPAGASLRVSEGPWPYLPVENSPSLAMEGHSYEVAADGPLESGRVYVPGGQAVIVDGLLLSNLSDPAGDSETETIRVEVVNNRYPTDANVLASGTVEVALAGAGEQDVFVAIPELALEAGGEYYVRLTFTGAPVAGRLPVLALETRWDDAIPVGLDGYAPYDDAGTSWAEGFYGSTMLDLFAEDEASKVDGLLSKLATADYIVITSNRVYGSIAQLPTRYPMTLHYYEMLFGGRLGFDHVAEITSYPGIGPFEVPDQAAEEAWHVYDHPKVDIFKRSADFDPDKARVELEPLTSPEVRTWAWPEDKAGAIGRLSAALLGRLPGVGAHSPAAPRPVADVMLSPERLAAQRSAGTWSRLFDPGSWVNRSPWLAAVAWYVALLALGVLAFPLVALALGDLADRGWAVARIAGLLMVSWFAWLVASIGLVAHTPRLVTFSAVLLGAASFAAWRRAGDNGDLSDWVRRRRRLLLAEEGVFLALFVLFLVIRAGNPDLWHPYFGGEKPMDFAYFNATLRTVSFPPYDPWFAGGKMNYYYFGFVLVGALVELTRVVPWVAYNLAIPSLAAMTGTGVFGVVYSWARRLGRPHGVAAGAGGLGAMLAVVSGNLYQVQWLAGKLADLGTAPIQSALPGVQTAVAAVVGWWRIVQGEAQLALPLGDWYWKASRAIPPQGGVEPITEFPFFTFLYADLHAHMMALPITVLVLALALSWCLSWSWHWRPFTATRGLVRLFLAALAIGALWPTNTWDYPTYGLVVAGALAAAHWGRRPRLDVPWLLTVGTKGLLLLGGSLLLFLPYHQAYVRPYGDFGRWLGPRTPLSAYLTVHGIFLFAIVTWVGARAYAVAVARARTSSGRVRLAATFLAAALLGALLASAGQWTLVVASLLGAGGAVMFLRKGALPPERFAGWLLVVGALLTAAVEYVVLQGDIGRMNTVFKFYIQVWVLWAALAAVAVAWAAPLLRRVRWSMWWWGALALLVASGLTYPITAARAKMADRFPAAYGMAPEDREGYTDNYAPGLSGMEFLDYAQYDDDGNLLHLRYDRDGIRWFLENVEGTPVVLEGFREKGYRWGSRYSIYTGLPAVVGWDWHETQQRNAVGAAVVRERTADVREMYDTTDLDRARQLLDKYGVEYVVVGEMERAFYAPEGLAKFDDLVAGGDVEVAYRHPEGPLTIYRVLTAKGGAG